jgi:hypothetical protein
MQYVYSGLFYRQRLIYLCLLSLILYVSSGKQNNARVEQWQQLLLLKMEVGE